MPAAASVEVRSQLQSPMYTGRPNGTRRYIELRRISSQTSNFAPPHRLTSLTISSNHTNTKTAHQPWQASPLGSLPGTSLKTTRTGAYATAGSAPRGLGLELVRQLVAALNNFAIAAVRNPDTATQLKALKPAAGSELHLVQLDVSDEASIRASVGKAEAVLAGRGLDYLWNNAGIVRPRLLVRVRMDADHARRRARKTTRTTSRTSSS